MAISDGARSFDHDRVEDICVLQQRMDRGERRDDRDVAFLEEADGALVEEGRVLDGVDAGLGRDAHAPGAVGVRGDPKSRVVGFSHGGGRLLGSELRYLRRRAFAQHPSGREDLDDPSARADLLADRFPHLIGSIGNASDLGPVTAGGRHAPASGDDPRSFDHAALDRAAELDDHRSIRAKVAYGRHTGVQRGACVLERLDHRQAVGLSHLGREVRLAIERQVRVTVDEAGDREAARGLSDLAAVFRQRLSLTRPRDLAAIDDDRRVLDDVFAVKKPVELEHRSHRPQYRPPMPDTLLERLRARDLVLPDYAGGGLINVAATMLDILGARNESDPLPLRDLSMALREGVRQVLVVLADGLGLGQLRALCASGDVPFLASLLDRAGRNDGAQLIEARTIFPSTTAAAITTLNTARTPQEHGNLAYFVWLEEFAAVTQMLRWGPGVTRRGSFFDNQTIDPRDYVKVPSVHRRLRERGAMSYVVEPEIFRKEAMTRMHAAEANYAGYFLPSTMGVQVRELLETRPWGERPAYLYAYWSGIDATAHIYGPSSSACATEAALFDLDLSRALADRPAGDTLVLLTADHGHATTNPDKLIDLVGDEELRGMLRNPIAGEPRCAFLHTDAPAKVRAHLERRYPGAFFLFDRDEAIEAGLFGRGDAEVARRRIGEVCAMLTDDRAASIVRVDGQTFRHRGSHGGMTHDEMDIPILAWRV